MRLRQTGQWPRQRPLGSRARSPRTLGGRPWRIERVERPEAGFTLVELLITLVILPLVVGGIAVCLTTLLANENTTKARISDSADAQLVNAYFDQDVQSAQVVTTNASATQCGSGTMVLGLQWDPSATAGGYQTVVTYSIEPGSGSNHLLVRNFCANGASTSPTTTYVVSSDVPATLAAPTVSCSSTCAPTTSWVAASIIKTVTLSITEPASGYSYSLTSDPRAGNLPSSGSTQLTSPNTGCGFAAPGTGTYAATLCFVNFAGYNYAASPTGCGGNSNADPITAAITNTPYILSFCIAQSSSLNGASLSPEVAPWPIPTYTDPPTSEAFLGNNGFYTDIPGDPALYQTVENSQSVITITNISLSDANGTVASGWDLATGDAESTDQYESIVWTASSDLSLMPNSPTSQIGNACPGPNGTVQLTGVGTTTVECAASISSDKTGTVMLEAPAPTSLTVTLDTPYKAGQGLEAIYVGVLLS